MEVTTDGGATWHDAELDDPVGEFAWRRWTWWWDVEPGRHLLSARATDVTGAAQPRDLDASPWNRGGFANNALQQLEVLAVDGDPTNPHPVRKVITVP